MSSSIFVTFPEEQLLSLSARRQNSAFQHILSPLSPWNNVRFHVILSIQQKHADPTLTFPAPGLSKKESRFIYCKYCPLINSRTINSSLKADSQTTGFLLLSTVKGHLPYTSPAAAVPSKENRTMVDGKQRSPSLI
uniref:DUF262 domain-containing protein n=1 Tax=Steinernema glaseri TaxID=37863 RepID=A0A1I7YV54_9BILA